VREEKPNGNERNMFAKILLFGTHLTDLTFCPKLSRKYLMIASLKYSCTNSLSSTLTKLTINVKHFDDCLYLHRGCIPSLSTLIIRIKEITCSWMNTYIIQ
jgi:hypothetical protein